MGVNTLRSKATNAFLDLINQSIGIVIWVLIFLPGILAFIIPLAILRIVVNQLAKFIRPDLIPITNPIDHIISLQPSSAFPVKNAAQVWKLRGRLDIESFREHFYQTFLSTEELRLKYRNLYCYFVQWMLYGFKKPVDVINLEDRIREHKLMDGSLDEFIGVWMSTNDYGDRPNWEILIIHLQDGRDGFIEESSETVLLFKIDHGLCDGYTFVHLIEKLTGIKSPYIVKSEETSIWTMMKLILTYPKVLVELSLKFASSQDPFKKYSNVSNKSSKWMVSFTSLNLQAVKAIRQKTKTHFNTVLGIIQAGSIRRLLLETGRVSSEFPKLTWFLSPVGWPEHPAMTQEGGMTNHLSLNLWRNPFGEEVDPFNRLLGAEKEFEIYEAVGIHKTFKWIVCPVSWVIPSPILAWFLQNLLKRCPVSDDLSPLMCSREQYQLMGHQVDHLYLPVQVPAFLPSVQIYVVPVSNSGRLDVSINANSKLFKSQEKLDVFTKIYMKEELDKLLLSCELNDLDQEDFSC